MQPLQMFGLLQFLLRLVNYVQTTNTSAASCAQHLRNFQSKDHHVDTLRSTCRIVMCTNCHITAVPHFELRAFSQHLLTKRNIHLSLLFTSLGLNFLMLYKTTQIWSFTDKTFPFMLPANSRNHPGPTGGGVVANNPEKHGILASQRRLSHVHKTADG
jgi:hypothetical protein